MVQELQQINLDIVVKLRVAVHYDSTYLVHVVLLKERADVDHELLETIRVFLDSLLLFSNRIIEVPADRSRSHHVILLIVVVLFFRVLLV